MKKKKIVLFVIIIYCLRLSSPLSSVSALESPILLEGHNQRVPDLMFENHLLVDSIGLSIMGIHTYGAPTITDLVAVGTDRYSGMYAVQGYWPNMTNHLPSDYHSDNGGINDADIVRDMVKFLNPINGNMEIIYAEGNSMDDDGKIVKQVFVNPTKSDGALVPEWTVNTDEQVIALTLGNFDSDPADLEVAGLCLDGNVYVVDNIQSGSPTHWKHDLDAWTWSNFRNDHIKTPITEIEDLDGDDLTKHDIVFGWNTNVSAISTNTSNREIWNVNVDASEVTDLVAVDDQNSDGLQDVVVTTKSKIILLNGANGTTLGSFVDANGYFRDVEVYNSTAIITGNGDGIIMVWDINTTSPTFGDTILTADWGGWDINDLLIVEDLDDDGINEIAVGGDSIVGVVYGSNLTKIWARSPYGSSWNGGPIDVFDLELLDDLSGDGFGDLAVTGYSDHGAIFVFSTYGGLDFIPDLSGNGSADINCTEDENHIFLFTATAKQSQGLTVTTEINIDNGTWIAMTKGAGSWETGVNFTYEQGGFSNGEHTFKFRFTDTTPDVIETSVKTFQIGNCEGNTGLDIPGASIGMLIASIGLGIAVILHTIKKHRQ
ncbi:hypothetical protein DSAG12_01029 [Promethearchaeum syntrophicum]|uniref:Uncharacterized protein n=1 Tax=Promethearchaeum syntrophicum TaxID=2594042 RepID=A0A5B9D851_9ARCH|nr:hypothetical protein [Candidatus Prometheoarchaeum syntrophicum]QEE15205.1 hypothetical protein DSAG12_01029 [Candidatus Prometheoarchaeum syntrophicum]